MTYLPARLRKQTANSLFRSTIFDRRGMTHHLRLLRTTALCVCSALALSACGASTSDTKPVTSANQTARPSLKNVEARLDKAVEEAVKQAENAQTTEESLRIYEELVQLRPRDPIIATKYARKLREDKQIERAEAALNPFAQNADAHPAVMTEMAMITLSKGDYTKAEEMARIAIDKVPNNGRAYLALGTALDAQGDYEDAETAFREGIKYWKGDPAPIMNNFALNLASQGKLQEALTVLTRAREISPHRMEIERNYRIIATLLETSSPAAPKPFKKPEAQKPAVKKETKTEAKPKIEVKEVKETVAVPPKTEKEAEEKKEEASEAPVKLQLQNRSVQSWQKKKNTSAGND
jgi:Flp pilus assembly protein TadD